MIRRLVLTASVALFTALLLMAGTSVSFMIVVPVGVGIVVLLRTRGAQAVEIGWSGDGIGSTTADGRMSGPSVAAARRTGSVPFSLGRVEGRELVFSALFAVGLGFWLILYAVLGAFSVADVDRSWREGVILAALLCHPFVAMTVVAAHRNRSRSRRDGCDEIFDACPATREARTLGHLVTAWIPASVCMAAVIGLAALMAVHNPRTYGPLGADAIAAVLACGALGAGAVALGVTLARWTASTLAPVLAIVVVGVVSAIINDIGSPAWATDRLLATFLVSGGVDPIFLSGHWWARLAWLSALGVLVAAIGVIRPGGTRAATLVAAFATVVALVAGVLAVRPAAPDDAQRIADLLAEPMRHETCHRAGAEVRVCAYGEYDELAERVADQLRPVAAAVPRGALGDVTFATLYTDRAEQLQAEVRDALHGRRVAEPSGVLRLRYSMYTENFLAARLRLAARAVGLPTEPHRDGLPTVVAGQGRGVLVLWLASRGLGDVGAEDFVGASGDEWPALCAGEGSTLQWAPSDVAAANTLLSEPSRTADAVRRDWRRLTASNATTDDVLRATGHAPLGPPAPIRPTEATC